LRFHFVEYVMGSSSTGGHARAGTFTRTLAYLTTTVLSRQTRVLHAALALAGVLPAMALDG
jgi:hypothetical protein